MPGVRLGGSDIAWDVGVTQEQQGLNGESAPAPFCCCTIQTFKAASGPPRQRTGASLDHLPPYSPDLTPMENAFVPLKAGLRRPGESTIEGLVKAVGRLLDDTSAEHCWNFIRTCWYG